MRKNSRPVPGKTVWVLFFIMTLLMGFPFLFYYRYSTTGRDLMKSVHLYAGNFGESLCRYFEDMPVDEGEALSRELLAVPLIPGAGIEIYDGEGFLIARRPLRLPDYETEESGLYERIRKLIKPFRHGRETGIRSDSEQIRERLLRNGLKGNRGVDYAFPSGRIGDRILYFSYPLRDYSRETHPVKGVLFMEYRDITAGPILQKQRSQFALTSLIFGILLLCYPAYVLWALVFPLRRVIRKFRALERGTEYLLPDEEGISGKSELGALTGHLSGIRQILDSRDRETESYMSEIRHILRNPLSNIQAALEGLMMGKSSEADQAFFSIIQKNLRRIDKYVTIHNPLSDIWESGMLPEAVDIDAFLKKIIGDYACLVEKKSIRFSYEKPENPPVWRGFNTPLRYACEQIIDNAVDFSPAGGVIAIEVSSDGKAIVIGIADQGPGLLQGREEDVFGQYVSFRPQIDSEHSGTGLYLSRNALRKIGGSLRGRNGIGGGALFTITLPLLV